MRASRWFFALCIMCGVSLFAMATALWPTRAYADDDRINVSDTNYWCLTLTQFSGFTSQDINITMNNNETATLDNLRSTSGSNNKYIDMTGLSNSSTIYILSSISGGSLTKGMKFWLEPKFGNITYYNTSNNFLHVSVMPSQYKYFGRSSTGTWYDLTPENGLFTAPARINFICVAGNARGSGAMNGYSYAFAGSLGLDVFVSMQHNDVVSAIEGQTTDINEQSEQNTQDILDGQQLQTNELKDTTGSNSIVGPATTQGQNVFQNLNMVSTMQDTFSNISQAITTQESDTGIPFPGLQMAGFVIPAYNVDPTQMMPEIMPYVKGVLTFVFCCAFLSHIVHLIQAIFGIYDYGEMVFYDDHTMPVSPAVNTSFKPDYNIDEDLGF